MKRSGHQGEELGFRSQDGSRETPGTRNKVFPEEKKALTCFECFVFLITKPNVHYYTFTENRNSYGRINQPLNKLE